MTAWYHFLVALAATSVIADSSPTYPELARGGAARIVSGWEAQPGQFPYQLNIRMVNPSGTINGCGGTIIHHFWALTAAHCTANRRMFVIRAGATVITRPLFIFEAYEYHNHPLYIDWLPLVQPNDISVIKFEEELLYNDYVQPIRLQSSFDQDRNYDGVRLTASGWGITWTEGEAPEHLNWVYLTGVTNEVCREEFGGIIQDSTICASAYNVSSQSVCQGDSGGPLTVIDYDGQVTEVGIASFVSGTGCHTDYPAGFIRPGHYHTWLLLVTGINFDWENIPPPVTTQRPETDAPTTRAPKTEAPTTRAPETDAPTTRAPKTEAPTTRAPETDAPTTRAPKTEAPTTRAPETDAPTTRAPKTEAPTTRAPKTEAPTTRAPETDAPTTRAPETDAPTTRAPKTEAPTTRAPKTEAPTTRAPETDAPTTRAPETDAPTTRAPETDAPTTRAPETDAPTTRAPETDAPTTRAPETDAPTTRAPKTEAPTTRAPETDAPTTRAPKTEAPTTRAPKTEAPTTRAPETDAPTTRAPETDVTVTENLINSFNNAPSHDVLIDVSKEERNIMKRIWKMFSN